MNRISFWPCNLLANVAAAIVMLHGAVVLANPITYTLDPTQSKLTLTGNVNSSPFTAQDINTNVTSFSGTIKADRGASTIQFISGSSMVAAFVSGQVDPDRQAQVGFTDPFQADYAVQAPLAPMIDPVDTTTGYFTFFDLVLGATSASIPVAGGNFAASGVTGQFTSGFYAYVRYGDLYENIPNSGTPTLVGNAAVNGGTTGSLLAAAGVETLTLPVNLTFTSNNADGINVTFTLTGNLVATAPVPEPSGLTLLVLASMFTLWRKRMSR